MYLHTHTQYTICCKFTEITADFHFSSDLKYIFFLLLLSDPHTHTLLLYLFSFLFCGAVVFVKISYCTHKKNIKYFFYIFSHNIGRPLVFFLFGSVYISHTKKSVVFIEKKYRNIFFTYFFLAQITQNKMLKQIENS